MWDFKFDESGTPLYLQIANALEEDIISGGIPPGHRLMSHRELAHITGVTVSTATRAYAEAENRGLIKTEAGRGTFVMAMCLPTLPYAGEETAIEMRVVMPLFMEEPSIRPILQKVAQYENLDALVKCFAPAGFAEHRKIAAEWLRRTGLDATAESLLMAAGHPHGLHSIFYALFKRADKIAVGKITNPCLISLAKQAGFELKGVEMDADGMIPEKLDELCETADIKGIYLVAGINNISAKSMPPKRREALANIIARHNLTLVEDDAYSAPEIGKALPMTTLLPENAVYLMSFSSVVYSALRVAFIHTPAKFHAQLANVIVENMWTVPPLCVALACECIANGTADRAILQKRKEIARRVGVLKEKFSDLDISCSEQALYAWIRLPDSWDGRDFEFVAEKSGVRVLTADKLAAPGGSPAPNYVRLAITGPSDITSFKKGLDILASLIKLEKNSTSPIW